MAGAYRAVQPAGGGTMDFSGSAARGLDTATIKTGRAFGPLGGPAMFGQNAEGVAEVAAVSQPVLAPQLLSVLRRPREPLARNGRPKRSAARVQMPVLAPQQAQSIHPGDGQERDK